MKIKKPKEHYVNNKEFTAAVHEHVMQLNEAEERGLEAPLMSDYIGDCFMRMCKGLAQKPNFRGYSWVDDMMMDGAENCVKAISNYNLENATRSGTPNAFGYFTMIIYRAFLRRIAKENRQRDIRQKFIRESGISAFADASERDNSMITERIKSRMEI